MGYYRLFIGSNGAYYFSLNAENNQVILQSEGYTAKAGAENGIESVRENSPTETSFERKISNDDQYYFVLKARNGEIIGVSEMYRQRAGMENGIESVMKNGPDSTVRDET
ncbi:MAG: hypothetical protein ACJAUD_002185 [Crocinitomicaceae bacterium]|jgi:uncharacterized protein YegP (UPF0339 family)